eukprot:6204659-Pleurochrysis_carterae.AAC.3
MENSLRYLCRRVLRPMGARRDVPAVIRPPPRARCDSPQCDAVSHESAHFVGLRSRLRLVVHFGLATSSTFRLRGCVE